MTTTLVPKREEALRVGFKATDWSSPVSFESYSSQLAEWDIRLIERDGEPIGAVYSHDGEVHASVLPEWRGRWATRGILRQLFAGDRVFTKVSPGHDDMYGILKRLGFTRTDGNTLVKEK